MADNMSVSNGKRINPSLRWVFTWNNYPINYRCRLDELKEHLDKWVWSQEVGESGTPHIQGFVQFKKKVRPIGYLPTDVHWEKAVANDLDQVRYCTKSITMNQELSATRDDHDVSASLEHHLVQLNRTRIRTIQPSEMYVWQRQLLTTLLELADDRSIIWIWEQVGNSGKSAMCKYICANMNALICSGKAADIKHMIVKQHELSGRYPDIVIFDIPRSNLQYVSYTGIEEIKNGCFASSKYEGGMVLMNSPHVVCFANEPPQYAMLSEDRWIVTELTFGDCVRPSEPDALA